MARLAEPAQAGSEEAGAELILVTPGEFEQALGAAEPVEDIADRADDDPAVIIYTSGTTGTPKGATLTHANLAAGAETARDLVDAGPDTVTLATLPLFHVFGMNSVMNVSVRARGLLTLLPRFEPAKALEIIQRDKVTTFAGVPTMYTALLHHPERGDYDTSSLDLSVSGGSAMPVEVLRGFDEAFGTKVLEGYGLSETTGMGSFNLPSRERKPGSIGVPIGGTEFRLVDDDGNDVPDGEPGEIAIRGAVRDAQLLGARRRHARDDPRRLVADRRHGDRRRRRLLLHRRPQEGLSSAAATTSTRARSRRSSTSTRRSARPRWWACRTTRWARRSAPRSR